MSSGRIPRARGAAEVSINFLSSYHEEPAQCLITSKAFVSRNPTSIFYALLTVKLYHAKAISYTVGFVSRKRPFSTVAQIGLSYTVEKGHFRLDFFD